MSYPIMYARYLNLPRLPENILSRINFNFHEYTKGTKSTTNRYLWSDQHNSVINEWCQKNVSSSVYYAFQIMGDLDLHKDNGTKTKLCYLLQAGGDNVYTDFYDDTKTKILQSIKLETHRWHILKTDVYHLVRGVDPQNTRFSITGRLFE